MRIAARWSAAWWARANLSVRMARPRHCLSRLMHRSTALRCLYASVSKDGGRPPALPRRRRWPTWSDGWGMTARIPRLRGRLRLHGELLLADLPQGRICRGRTLRVARHGRCEDVGVRGLLTYLGQGLVQVGESVLHP